jgi:hypothetical protein
VDVLQNQAVTLDATQSVGAASFSWSQVSGAAVDLGTADQPKLTFTFPKTASDVVLRLTVRNPGVDPAACAPTTCASVDVTLRPTGDPLTITKARFTANGSRWVVTGTATSTSNNNVHVYSGLSIDPSREIGSSPVLADKTWAVDVRDSTIPVTTCGCVTVVSDRGGQISDFKLEKPQNLPATTVPPTVPTAAASLATRVPLLGVAGARAAAPARVIAPATVSAAAVAGAGVPVSVTVPTGTTLVRLRVLTSANKALFSTFKKVKGATKVKVNIKSAKLRKQLRTGKRYVIEVRAGTAKNRLGKATRKVIRIRA